MLDVWVTTYYVQLQEVITVRCSAVTAKFLMEHVEENMLKVNLLIGKENLSVENENLLKDKLSTGKENLSKENMLKENPSVLKENLSVSFWIIPPSIRNNGLHCVFVQVRKLVGYFSNRVPSSLHGELSSFSHLKQGNGVRPYKVYVSSHNGVTKKSSLNIWMDIFGLCCLQVVLFQQLCMVWSK